MTDTPQWFLDALSIEPDHIAVDVEGAAVHALVWGETGRPGIVLVHGGAAHAHWWSHIAPAFLPDFRVVAIDQASGTEVTVVGPASAGPETLSRTAADKLRWVLRSRAREPRRRAGLEV